MSLAAQLGVLKETFDNKNATLRILFEQRLDTLRNNIISFIGNALHDETAAILNESDTTRAFVVDRILEIVSDNIESEKETTIFKLINKMNQLTKECDTLTIKNKELKEENDGFIHKQKNIHNNSEALDQLKQTLAEKEMKIKCQSDKIKSIDDELKIKTHEFERQQTQNDEQHEQIQTLHEKLENTLKNLQHQQAQFEQYSIENTQFKNVNHQNQKEMKKCRKQIESLTSSLMKSESERLVLSKQYMDIGNKLESITNDQNKHMKQVEKDDKDKHNEILIIKHQFQELIVENKALKKKLHEQSHCLSKKMKKELSKTRTLCDDVSILRKQLESERNISKMYVDELQKLKLEVNTKNTEMNFNERKITDTISSQTKKIHKYYQKMVDSNMSRLQKQYESHIKDLEQQYEEKMDKIKNDELQKFEEQQKILLSKMKENQEEYNKDKEKWSEGEIVIKELKNKLDEYTLNLEAVQKEMEKYQKENEILRDEITEIKIKHNEEKESFQRLLHERQKQNENLTDIASKLQKRKDSIQQTKCDDKSKANAMEYDLKQQIECLTLELQQNQKENKSMELRLSEQKHSKHEIEKWNRKYQQRLDFIRAFCRNICSEIRNNKNEIDYMKSSVAMYLERMFHEIKISFKDIQSKSAKCYLKSDSEIKQKLSKSMNEFKQIQDLKLESIEQKVKYALINSHKISDGELMDNMKELDIDQLQNEVNTIKNELAQAKNVLSPKKITFKKISMPSSITSSMIATPSRHDFGSNMKVIKPKTYTRRESFDTETIRKLRSDLQSLESNYKYSKKQNEKEYSGPESDSLNSSSVVLQ